MKLEPFNQTFGLPPSTYVSDSMIVNSMPIIEIIPCKPHFDSGLNLFRVEDDRQAYDKILDNHGFSAPNPLKLAFIADNFPTDTFVNDYGETFLQKFTDVASQGMSQIMQMTGSDSATEGGKKIAGMLSNAADDFGESTAGGILKSGASGLNQMAESLHNFSQSSGKTLGGSINLIDRMLAGHRVDFPQVWRNSSYTPSYTATIRLYNPYPGNPESTKKYIIGPLASILCLALPRSDDGSTFNWPFFHKIKSKGIYNLDPAVITNITVVKGGDHQQIAYNQNLSVVDVRLDFISLYNSILLEEGKNRSTNRPTLRSYLDALSKQGDSYNRLQMREASGRAAGVTNKRDSVQITSLLDAVDTVDEQVSKTQAPLKSNINNSSRIPSYSRSLASNLITTSPSGFIKR